MSWLSAFSPVERIIVGAAALLTAVFLITLLDTIGLAKTFSHVVKGRGYELSDMYLRSVKAGRDAVVVGSGAGLRRSLSAE